MISDKYPFVIVKLSPLPTLKTEYQGCDLSLNFIIEAEIDQKACEEIGTKFSSLKVKDKVVLWGMEVEIYRIRDGKFYFWKNVSSLGCESIRDVNELLLRRGLLDEWNYAVEKRKKAIEKQKEALKNDPIHSLEL